MNRSATLILLGFGLALALVACDYGVADGEDPALLDESWESLEYGLRADEGAEAERLEGAMLPAAPEAPLPVGYVSLQNRPSSGSLPVQHPDPKPWKK